MELLKLLNTGEIVAQTVCFILALAILRAVLWKPFLGILEARRRRIAGEIRDIKDTKTALANMKADYDRRIASIDEEAAARFDAALAEAKKRADEMRLKAEKDGERIIENAKANIRDELAKAKDELKDSMVDLTIRVAQTVIQEKLTVEDDRKLVAEFLKSMEKK